MAASWLNDAVFYEIYPQSFYDSNGDGIGDIPGIIGKLDYVKSLGCNALWINPCFDSPFKDAGYDVRDYKRVAPRYGTNEDLVRLFQTAHEKGIRVLLDLIPGHTSEEHPWFQASCQEEPNEYSGRYIWTNAWFARGDGMPFVSGEAPRNGAYILNFFKCQPALNYGYGQRNLPWQQATDSPDALATRAALWDIMQFWLELGCDGFRVDMAGSLVKNDTPDCNYTQAIYREIRDKLDAQFPEAALVAEWGLPRLALNCGFDMDFYLEWHGNGYSTLMRDYDTDGNMVMQSPDTSYFKQDSGTDVTRFLADYLPQYTDTKDKGLWCFLTCNHDTTRPSFNLTPEELKVAYSLLFTMPGAPFLYYGDEIGMAYRKLPSKEGGYTRTGSRTPMQWSRRENLGFSTGTPESLYLPVDPSPKAPTVEEQEEDPQSLLHYTRSLIALRHSHPDLQAKAPFAVYSAEPGSRLFAYKRGNLLCTLNPGKEALFLHLDGDYRILFSQGNAEIQGQYLKFQGFTVLEPTAGV